MSADSFKLLQGQAGPGTLWQILLTICKHRQVLACTGKYFSSNRNYNLISADAFTLLQAQTSLLICTGKYCSVQVIRSTLYVC